ncbi:MAG: hypothetical protein NZO58_10210 [Gemmataceae bacterium]|nr:hypothetical protein [Gemmataceae bacterium]
MRMHMARRQARWGAARPAFTLIELLVAMGLTLFTMLILTQAFVTALETFRGLKAIGDMQARLRTATAILRADLGADHFEGKRRLSDADLPINPPVEGYFCVRQGSASVLEGVDAEGQESVRSIDHVLAFTIRLRGNRPENFLTTRDIPTFPPGNPQRWSPLSLSSTNYFNQDRDALFNPGGPPNWPTTNPFNLAGNKHPEPDIYASQWAEVAYFLVPTGTTNDVSNPASGGVPLFGLFRGQHLLVPNNFEANKPDSVRGSSDPCFQTTVNDALVNAPYYYAGVSCYPRPNPVNQLYFNSPSDLANRTVTGAFRTAGMDQRVMAGLANPAVPLPLPSGAFPPGTAPGRPPRGSTLVVPNVVSFNVQVLYPGATAFTDVAPLQNVSAVIRLYDTTLLSAAGSPIPAALGRIVAIKITLRVWDDATKFSRQVTVVQDL